jgi:hypothetical protein
MGWSPHPSPQRKLGVPPSPAQGTGHRKARRKFLRFKEHRGAAGFRSADLAEPTLPIGPAASRAGFRLGVAPVPRLIMVFGE